jgi:hypothetical protein
MIGEPERQASAQEVRTAGKVAAVVGHAAAREIGNFGMRLELEMQLEPIELDHLLRSLKRNVRQVSQGVPDVGGTLLDMSLQTWSGVYGPGASDAEARKPAEVG